MIHFLYFSRCLTGFGKTAAALGLAISVDTISSRTPGLFFNSKDVNAMPMFSGLETLIP